jgi:hypothetical protein
MFSCITNYWMKKLENCFLTGIIIVLLSFTLSIHGQVSGPGQVIVHTNASYIHSLNPAAAGTSYLWEADEGDILFAAWDSVVVNWDSDGNYSVYLSLLDSSDYSAELLDELPVTVVIPVVEYAYDAAGNRTGRSIVYYSNGNKKSKKLKKELKKKLEITSQTVVYPNPADKVIYLKLSNEMFEAGKKQYILYDNLGKMVERKDIDNTITEINVSQLNDGIYYLVLIYDSKRKDWKIVKN